METIDNKPEVLSTQHWPKLGCINHDCGQCQAQRKPLTDEQISNIIDNVMEGGTLDDLARAIEAAHGIK